MNEFNRKALELADAWVREERAYPRGNSTGRACTAARAALVAHLEGVEQKWLPIESAPKDGTSILLGYRRSGYSEEGRWMDDPSRNHWGEVGWFATSDNVLCDHPGKPDCWMHLPLPATPTEEQSQ